MKITAQNAAVVAEFYRGRPHLQPAPRPVAPAKILTLDSQDESYDDLLTLVDKACLPYCNSIEFRDDNMKRGYRALEFDVVTQCYNGYSDRDEDGSYRDSGKVREVVSVKVTGSMSLEHIAELVAGEVRGIESNCFS